MYAQLNYHMDKEWIALFSDALTSNKRFGKYSVPLLKGSFGTDAELKYLNLIVASIKMPRAIIVNLSTGSDTVNDVFHPYSILYYKGAFLINGFSEKTGQLEAIPVSRINKIEPLEAIDYRLPKAEEIESLTESSPKLSTTVSNNKYKSVKDMKTYWQEFNDSGIHKVGNRNQWYNEVRSLRFSDSVQLDRRVYFEICCQYGNEKQLIVNLILENKNRKNADGLDSLIVKIKSDVIGELDLSGFNVDDENWPKREGNSRRTIELCNRKLPLGNEDLRDPRTFPVQPDHFKWFNDHLDKLEVIFKGYLGN